MTFTQLADFSETLCGNRNYVSLDKRPDLIETVITHPDYSHISQRYAHLLDIYFYCEGSPSGVAHFACISSEKKQDILGRIDAITAALHC